MKSLLKIILGIIIVPTLVYGASVFTTKQGGTGTGTPPTLGQVLLGNADGTYSPVATSSLGITGGSGSGTGNVSDVDPVTSYSCAATTTTTTGTITSGTNSLVVASASGWSVGMGIAIKNAGTGGTTEHITYITNIVGTTFTLNDNAISSVTGQTVYHDDTRCLQRTVDSGLNPLLRLGDYNVTSEITITKPQLFQCSGAVNRSTHTGGTTIWNRGTTNNVLNISSGYVRVSNCTIQQTSTITPTDGYGITIGHPTDRVRFVTVDNNLVYGTYGGIEITGQVIPANIMNNFFWTYGGASSTAGAVYVNNRTTAGDLHWISNEFRVINLGPVGWIVDADVSEWTHNKFNSGNPLLIIDDTVVPGAAVIAQSFVNNSFEAGSNTQPMIQINGTSQGISFIGGEIGTDNSMGGIELNDDVSNIAVIGVDFNQSGTPVINNSTGDHIQIFGNISSRDGITVNSGLTGNSLGLGLLNPNSRLEIGSNLQRGSWTLKGPVFSVASGTLIDTSTNNATITTRVVNSFATSTLGFAIASSTITSAATVYIAGAPMAEASSTVITYPYSLYVNDGNSFFSSNIGMDVENPTHKLEISSTQNGDGSRKRVFLDTFSGGGVFGTLSDDDFYIQTENVNRMVIKKDTGYVAIGTTTPSATLDIVSNASTSAFRLASSTGQVFLNVTPLGYLGVNTSTPSKTLSVSGDFSLSGAFFDSTNASGTSGQVLLSTGTSTLWVSTSSLGISGGPGGSLTGTGSNGLLALWDSASSLVTSLFMDNGTVTGVGATSSLVKFNVQGSGTLNPLNIASSTGVSLFSISNTGRVMIGSGTPSSLLTVNQSTTTFQSPLSGTSVHFIGQSDSPFRMSVDTYSGASTFGSQIQFRRALGTSDTPSAVTASSTLFTIASDGYGTTGFHASSITSISGMAEGPFTDTSAPSILRFFTTATGSVTSLERFLIGSNGRLSIGTTSIETVATSSPYLKLDFFARDLAGNTVLSTKIASTTEITLQPAFASRRISMWTSGGSATGYQFGLSQTSSSTGVDTVPTFANGYTSQQRTLFSTVVTTLNQQVGIRSNVNFFRSATTSFGGFYAVADFGFTSWTAGNRFYTGFSTCTSGDCIASTSTIVNRQDIAGFMVDGMTNTLVFATNDNAGVISTSSIPGMPTFAANSRFRTYIYSPAGDPNIYWRIDNMISGLKIGEGVATTNLMRRNVNHAYINLCSNGANTAANACQLGMMRFYIESQ